MTTDTDTTAQGTTEAATGTEGTAATETGKDTLLTGDAAGKAAGDVEADKGAGTEGDKKAEGDGDGKKTESKSEDDKAAGPPEKYEFTMPDGMALDKALAEKVDPVLRELGLNNEKANKLAQTFAEYRASEAQRQHEAYAQQIEDWGKAARDDKEYGGAAFDENVKLAQTAIGTYGTPELKTLLADGLGNHPELIRFCVKVGKAMSEDGGVNASSKTPAQKSSAAVLYDHPTSQSKR